jgi:predicted HAD superfamily Cof-like phosphohydrolase
MSELSTFRQVKDFHQRFGHPVVNIAQSTDLDTVKLRLKLILEEFIELTEASTKPGRPVVNFIMETLGEADSLIDELKKGDLQQDVVSIADALGDIKYVVDGAALCWGIDLDRVSTEIHNSNMSKLGSDGNPIYREDGKILKGPHYYPPNILGVLEQQASELGFSGAIG